MLHSEKKTFEKMQKQSSERGVNWCEVLWVNSEKTYIEHIEY
jgi:hypothetical protein